MFELPSAEPPADLLAHLPADTDPDLLTATAHAWRHAPFLRGLIRSRAAVLQSIVEQGYAATVQGALARAEQPSADIAATLRAVRGDFALTVALADLARAWPLEQVTRALSDFADAAVNASIAAALAERGAPNIGFVALALGKLGSHELNFSSDIDLILLYEPGLMPCRPREEPEQAAVRIARRVVALLGEMRPDGYVFRVDLRLRPASEITPIALSFAAAEQYYQSEALTWERVAFLRARSCAGDVALGETFLAAIRGFVWRRSLDYTAIRDIQAVSLRIRDHFEAGQVLGPGFDLKRGRGGIREIEFFTQIHQLIWGGRDPSLRTPATLDGLVALARAGRIGPADETNMAHAYRLLRTVEHRLQMRADEQTHAIPLAATARTAVAALCGMKDYRQLERRLGAATKAVARRYDRLIADALGGPSIKLPTDAKALSAWLKPHGAVLARTLPEVIARWRGGQYRALRTEEAKVALETVLPTMVSALAGVSDPERAVSRLDSFLAKLPTSLQFFALLAANPKLVDLLARLLGSTPVLADSLAQDPALFDVLLGDDAFRPLPAGPELAADLRAFVGQADHEDILDRVRRWSHERRFQIGAQLIEGVTDPLRAATDLAGLADAAVQLLLEAVSNDMARSHGRVPGGGLIVLAMGRYGGGSLTHASDLDLVYLFSGDSAASSDGPKPLAGTNYFNRLAARLTGALSVGTVAGRLYEVDTRLRPWGAKGLLAVSVESFLRYQAEDAETWEHMALTRARVIAGEAQHGPGIAPAIRALIEQRGAARDAAVLRRDVVAMRAEIAAAKPGGGAWDVKLAPGGLVDLEFIVHFLQLRERAAITPDMAEAIGLLTGPDRLPPGLAEAHALLTRLLVMLRLIAPDADTPPTVAAVALLAKAARVADPHVELGLAKQRVVAAWEGVFEQPRRMRKPR